MSKAIRKIYKILYNIISIYPIAFLPNFNCLCAIINGETTTTGAINTYSNALGKYLNIK